MLTKKGPGIVPTHQQAFNPMKMTYRPRTRADSDSDDTFFVPRSVRDLQSNTYGSFTASAEPYRGSGLQQVTWDDINLLDRTFTSENFESGNVTELKSARNELFEPQKVHRPMMNWAHSNGISHVKARSRLRDIRKESIVDQLLDSIYDSYDLRRYSVDSDTFTEYSTTSEHLKRIDDDRYTRKTLHTKG